MTIEAELAAELKEAMRAKDQRRLAVIRAVKSDLGRKVTEPGFSGPADDAVHLDVMESFVKRSRKSLKEYEAAGERGRAMVEKLEWEIDYLSRWLPSKLDEEATLALVEGAIAELGAGPGDAGRVIGHLMGRHRDELDGSLVSRLVNAALESA